MTLLLADGTPYDHTGSLTAAEPHVDETTGVVTLRMSFDNPDNLLLPGMYALARIPQAEVKDVVLAPQEGVSRDRRGRPLALIVNDQNIVEERLLDIVQDLGNTWVVREGLKPGDRIIVQGVQKAAVGAPVTPQERPEAPPEGATDGTATPVDAAAPADAAPAENAAPAADPAVETPGETPAEAEVEKTDNGN